MKFWLFGMLLILLLLPVFESSCTRIFDPLSNTMMPETFKFNNYEIKELEYNDKPYAWWLPAAFDDYAQDKNGVILFELNGQQYYHPVQIAQKMIHFIASYHRTGNYEYITKSELFAHKILERTLLSQGALFFPYDFDWTLGGFGIYMKAPWYSGMAQGQLLSAFVRLYNITKKQEYLQASHEIFKSFALANRTSTPWIAYIDQEGYYWIEEYPAIEPNHVLNGFIFAIYGLYDYYLMVKTDESKKLLQGAITTIAAHIKGYRREGKPSVYSLIHEVSYPFYHLVHTDQLKMLYKITGDSFFSDMATQFYNDYHENATHNP